MPLDIKNIDKKAALPEGIDFRKELIWEKIKTQKKSRLRVLWPWMVAAMVILGFGIFFLKNSKPIEITGQEIDLIVSNSTHDFPKLENPVLEFQDPGLIENKSPMQEIGAEEVALKPEVKEKVSDEIPIFKDLITEPTNPLKIASYKRSDDDLQEKKQLSPAAMRLKRSLQKINKEKAPDQTLIVEKFNLLQELQTYPLQASTGQKSTSIYNQLIKGKNE